MADENKPGVLENIKQRVAGRADALRAGAAAALKEKAAEIREVIGPQRLEPVTQPERPFGRDDGGHDVSRVVWTGHTVQTPEGQSYFAAAGLTENGYYRAAEVQVYGSDELWHWQGERHIDKEHAIASAESMSVNRLRGDEAPLPVDGAEPAWREVFGKEQTNMAELPEHVKAQADAEMAKTGVGKMQVQDMGESQRADAYDTKAMEVQREQQRQNALLDKQDKTPEQRPEPGKE